MNTPESFLSFQDLQLSAPLLRSIQEMGFEKPSEIQSQTLPILLSDPTDFIGLAATGTGKTAAFAIPLLERIELNLKGVQALVLCPTRELAVQVSGQIELMGRYLKTGGVRALPVYGGAGYGDQIGGLKRGASIVVGTPGRLVDHLKRGTLQLDQVQTIILDEADEMISMGFKDDLEAILSAIPQGQARTWLFSATMSPGVRKVAETYLSEPQQVQVNRASMLPQNVEQLFYVTQESNKPEVLCKLIDAADDFYGLIFFQTKALLVEVAEFLHSRGYAVDCLHGDMDQNARERTMKAFRDRRATILLCTDVASRGLDVKDVTHVVNYSLPRELDSYVHRIGRTARSGKSGVAMSLVTGSHRGLVTRIERMTRSRMTEMKIPTRKEIAGKKISKLLAGFLAQENFGKAVETMGNDWRSAISDMMPDEIAGRFLSMMHPDLFADKKAAEPTAPVDSKPRERSRDRDRDHHHEVRPEPRPHSRPIPQSADSRMTRRERERAERLPRSDDRGPSKGRPPFKKRPRSGEERAMGFGKPRRFNKKGP